MKVDVRVSAVHVLSREPIVDLALRIYRAISKAVIGIDIRDLTEFILVHYYGTY